MDPYSEPSGPGRRRRPGGESRRRSRRPTGGIEAGLANGNGNGHASASLPAAPGVAPAAPEGRASGSRVLASWLESQAMNVNRHAQALRAFRRDEFGEGAASPLEAHIQAANGLIDALRATLLRRTRRVGRAVAAARRRPTTTRLARAVAAKEHAHNAVQSVERIWDFYLELFGQRQSQFATWLLSCDRIALDCYQHSFLNLGAARSIPSPPPFSYMRTGFSPATFRRGIPLTRLGRQINPFPLIQLPYHRLINPWTLGAVLHEVSHNLHNDLGLERSVPMAIAREL